MALEQFRRTKMVMLSAQSMAYQAARAMADNHIGSVLVTEPSGLAGIITDRDLALVVLGGDQDPKTTRLSEVMSEEVVTCDIGGDLGDLVRLMRENGVRRVPITEDGRIVGLATFDDLVVGGSVAPDALRSIVTAQLEEEAPHKPAGMLHPDAPSRPERRAAGRSRALMRAKARAEATHNRLVMAVTDAAKLDRTRAERALLVGLCMLCRRLSAGEAHHFISQLPSMLQSRLEQCTDGPDRAVTIEAIEEELGSTLGLDPQGARVALHAISMAVSEMVTAGEIKEVRGQLPEDMKHLFVYSK